MMRTNSTYLMLVISNQNCSIYYSHTDWLFIIRVSTQEEIRTPTPIQAPAPQAGASTNSATWV